MHAELPLSVTQEVRDRCLCLHLQRAARAVGRRFDEALKPVGLNQGQYSLLISLNRPDAPRISDVAHLLALDRTTLTANLKPLARRGLLSIADDREDKRIRRLVLTNEGRNVLRRAVPIWRRTHAEIDALVPGGGPDTLKADLWALTFGRKAGSGRAEHQPQ